MKICGPKLSLCGLIISIWGIIQLVFMGIFYHIKSVALAEDLPLKETYSDMTDFYSDADRGYSLNAINCWIAACLYLFTLVVSGYQFYVNSRSSMSM